MLKNRLTRLAGVAAIAACALTFTPTVSSFAATPGSQTEVHRGYKGHAFVGARKGANIRCCAGYKCHVTGALPYGKKVHVYHTAGGWSNIGHGKWVANYLLVPSY